MNQIVGVLPMFRASRKDQEEMVRQWTLLEKERDEADQERHVNDLQREAIQRERERLLEEAD